MKEVKAIIRKEKLDAVVTELKKIENFPGLTISEVLGFGNTKASNVSDAFKDGEHKYVERIKLETVLPAGMVDEVVNIIQEKANTGNLGDGKIFVLDVDHGIKIRTNEFSC